ncbi:MAG: hypothetical protein U0264_14365 [Candidatus Kapaibacterium sp.]
MIYSITFLLCSALCAFLQFSSYAQTTLSLRTIPECASIRTIKYSPSGKYIFIVDEKFNAFLLTNTGNLIRRWTYNESYYDSVWNKQAENKIRQTKLFWSLERLLGYSKKLPEDQAKRFLANMKAINDPVLVPPTGLIIEEDTFALPTGKERKDLLPQYFENGYFANDSLLYITATISTMAMDTFKLKSAAPPETRIVNSVCMLEFSIPDRKENCSVLNVSFEKNIGPINCLTTFTAKDSKCINFLSQISHDTYPSEKDFILRNDSQPIGSIGLFNRKTSELVRTYGDIPVNYRFPMILTYSYTGVYAVPKGQDTVTILYAVWDSVQVCTDSTISTFPLHISPDNSAMFQGFKEGKQGFTTLYSRQNFYIQQAEHTSTNSMVLVIYQRGSNSWLVREYDNNWKVIKEKRIEKPTGGNKIYYTGYKALDNTICYVTMDADENWQLHYIPF